MVGRLEGQEQGRGDRSQNDSGEGHEDRCGHLHCDMALLGAQSLLDVEDWEGDHEQAFLCRVGHEAVPDHVGREEGLESVRVRAHARVHVVFHRIAEEVETSEGVMALVEVETDPYCEALHED